MKAAEYAEKFKKEGSTDRALYEVFTVMALEIKTIQETRKAVSLEALISIVDEIIQKWGAFTRKAGLVNVCGKEVPIHSEMFEDFLCEAYPEFYKVLQSGRSYKEHLYRVEAGKQQNRQRIADMMRKFA